VKFYYIYKALAHPETNGYVQPFTLAERLLHVQEAERRIGSEFGWLCDNMQNGLKHALGNAPNSEFIIDPEGRLVVQRRWSNPGQLRADLVRLVGAVENPTAASDIDVRFTPPPRVAASGVVPRLQLPGGTRAVKIEPQLSEQPYYVKLRAEVDQGLLDDGIGKLYLGFHLDPLYHVHWNNLVDPLRYRIRTSDGVTIVPHRGEGPRLEEPADVDPREFLLDIERDLSDQGRFLRRRRQQEPQPEQLYVSVDYFACNDEEGWCKPVTQEYVVTLELDSDGGWAMSRRGSRGGGGNSGGASPRGGFPGGGRNPGAAALPAGANRIMGGLFAVDADKRTLTIRQRSGGSITLQVGQDVTIVRNGQAATLADLQMRDMVMAVSEGEGKARTVVRLMARSFSGGGR
jgi:uncharacterized membrane protein YgcG